MKTTKTTTTNGNARQEKVFDLALAVLGRMPSSFEEASEQERWMECDVCHGSGDLPHECGEWCDAECDAECDDCEECEGDGGFWDDPVYSLDWEMGLVLTGNRDLRGLVVAAVLEMAASNGIPLSSYERETLSRYLLIPATLDEQTRRFCCRFSEAMAALTEVFEDLPGCSVRRALSEVVEGTYSYICKYGTPEYADDDEWTYQAAIELQFLSVADIDECRSFAVVRSPFSRPSVDIRLAGVRLSKC